MRPLFDNWNRILLPRQKSGNLNLSAGPGIDDHDDVFADVVEKVATLDLEDSEICPLGIPADCFRNSSGMTERRQHHSFCPRFTTHCQVKNVAGGASGHLGYGLSQDQQCMVGTFTP